MDYGRTELADRLAADYAAGTLRGGARRRLESLLPAHPRLRAAVRDWQARLMPLTAAIAPIAPPPRVWARIQARLDGTARTAAGVPSSWWERLALWRGLTALASVGLIGLAALLALQAPVGPPIVVVMNPVVPAGTVAQPGTPPSIVASISGDGAALVTRPLVNVALAPDRSLELWSVPTQGPARSLGLISPDRATVLTRRDVLLLRDTDQLAVSLEPSGGSPTGTATGPVIYIGKLNR